MKQIPFLCADNLYRLTNQYQRLAEAVCPRFLNFNISIIDGVMK